jgi:uncharacterized membrane protein
MTNFFRKRGREKLYKQWVEKEGLSPEDLPADLTKDTKNSKETNEISPHQEYRPRTGLQTDRLSSSISVRFILVMAMIIVVLLVALSVVSTVLIMRGC